MVNVNKVEENMILILWINKKLSVFSGINAKILEAIFCKNTDWLTSVKLKRTEILSDDQKILWIEVLPETDLGMN